MSFTFTSVDNSILAAVNPPPPGPLQFSGESLDTRLEFSISLSMLNNRTVKAPPRIHSHGKRKSLRHLIHAHVRRPDTHSRRVPELSVRAPVVPPDDGFSLPKLPSPLASFGGEIQWIDPLLEKNAPSVKGEEEEESTAMGNVIDSDDDEETGLEAVKKIKRVEAPENTARSSMPSLHGVPVDRRWSSSIVDKPPPLQRRRSLMFQPLLDVSAVGALIDTFTADQAPPITQKPVAAAVVVSRQDDANSGIIGGLRRAATVISSNRGKFKALRRRPSAADVLSAIESVQPNVSSPPPVASSPPPPPSPSNHVRRAGTLNLPSRPKPAAAAAAAAAAEEEATDISTGYAPIAVSLRSTRSRQFLLNTPLGEFSVVRTLGQGSYGKVKLMRSALTGEQFAVKIIKRYPPHKHRRGHAEYRKAKTLDRRVVREANLASILGQLHPHIVPLHDFRVTDTHFYLFYAYVNGVTLAERVGSGGLSEREARAVFKPVVETIRFCHQYSVIHRDIKLENVLIDYADESQDAWPLLGRSDSSPQSQEEEKEEEEEEEEKEKEKEKERKGSHGSVVEGRIKIIDFGLANFFDGASLMDTFCGSLPYTAPEILRGDAYVGPEIDVWSLGVLLYVMMTGQFPFEDPAQIRNFDKIMAGDFALRPTMSAELQDLLICMLEPCAKRRITMQGVLRHKWLHESAAVGVCCVHHPYALTDAVHDRHKLLLPGPAINHVVAREVATCLDRGLDDVTRQLSAAMAAGQRALGSTSHAALSVRQRHQRHQRHQWPSALHGAQVNLVEVPNSPVVSVYALVLQQIAMRRYYLELPATEPSGGLSTTLSSSSQLAGSSAHGGGLRDLAEPTAKSQTLIDRLATQLSHLVSVTGSRLVGASSEPALPAKGQSRVAEIADSLVAAVPPPVYTQPLSTGPPGTGRKRLRSSRAVEPPALRESEPRIRCIGALEQVHERIALPAELSSQPIEKVLGLVAALLRAHEITYTFVETMRMPMQKALDTSVFPLKTIAAMVSSAYQPLPPPPPPPVADDLQTSGGKRSLFHGIFSRPSVQPNSSSRVPQTGGSPRRRLTQLRAKASSRQPGNNSTLTIVHPHLSAAASSTAPGHCPSPPHTPGGDMPEITTTVPVKYATCVVFAQYSPSLNRWRETEVVEYYSCAVRIELVRISASSTRQRRYALLVDRMTGHKGKFALFRMFLLRMVAALPSMVPEKFEPRPAADPLITVC